MTQRNFGLSPCTIETHYPGRLLVDIVSGVVLVNPPGEDLTFVHAAADVSGHAIALKEIIFDRPELLEGLDIAGHLVRIRAVSPYDAVASDDIQASIPYPVELIGAIVNGTAVEPELEAVVDDDGNVMTLLLMSDAGGFLRYSGAWVPLNDIGVIEGLGAVPVRDEALDLYDPMDQTGQVLKIEQLPVKDIADVVPYQMPAGAPVPTVASIMPTLETPRDLPAAIAAAEADPSMRWFVERRVEALGLEVALPWS